MKKISLFIAIICAIGMIVAILIHNFMAICGYFCSAVGWAVVYKCVGDNE